MYLSWLPLVAPQTNKYRLTLFCENYYSRRKLLICKEKMGSKSTLIICEENYTFTKKITKRKQGVKVHVTTLQRKLLFHEENRSLQCISRTCAFHMIDIFFHVILCVNEIRNFRNISGFEDVAFGLDRLWGRWWKIIDGLVKLCSWDTWNERPEICLRTDSS